MRIKILVTLTILLGLSTLKAQSDSNLVQLSGMVLTGDNRGELVPIPYATIAIKGTGRGTYANLQGFFSIVVLKGEEVSFSSIGYKSQTIVVPDSLQTQRHTIVQLLTQDTIYLPETVVFPWPSRDNFRLEFLAMDVSNVYMDNAKKNLAKEHLARIGANMTMDADENNDYYLRQEARSYYHLGQIPPMRIFDPLAWKQFFEAWERGDFKRKQ